MIEAGRDGDVELTAVYAEDVADLCAILRLIESGALHEAAEAIGCLYTLVRDQIPIHLYDAVVPGVDDLDTLAQATRSLGLQTIETLRIGGSLSSETIGARPNILRVRD